MEKKAVKILVIDDTDENLSFMKAFLHDSFPNIVTYVANSGKKGIELAKIEEPDVIILDIAMPIMDGFEVCSVLKQNQQLKHIPIIALTAVSKNIESRIKALEMGADVFISKPIDDTELLAQVKVMLRIKASEDLIRHENKTLSELVLERTKNLKNELEERKKAEKQLLESEERYKKAQEMGHVGNWEYNPISQTYWGSDEARKIFGFEVKDINLTIEEVESCIPEKKRVRQALINLINHNAEYNLVYIIFTKDKHICKTIHSIAELEKDTDGNIIKVSGVISDITELKNAEEKLRKNQEMMVNSQSVAHICSYSTNLVVDAIEKSEWVCSPEFYKIFGIDENYPHTIGGWANFIHPDYRKEVSEYHESVVKERTSFNREYKIIRINDGAERWVHGTGKLEFDEKGNPIRMHGAIQDITDWKIAENKLLESIEVAEKADKMKSIFLAQMSHEIRTPINAIVGTSSLIKMDFEEVADEDQIKSFEIVERAGERIIRTIDLLINISDVQAGTYKPNPSLIDVHSEIIIPLLAVNKKFAKMKNVVFSFNIATDDTTNLADFYTLNQIFAHLIDNAIKYTENGEVNINILKNIEGKLVVEIVDTGIGIDNKYLPELFEPFSQEEMGYTRKFEGNGIGLALVKTYCEFNNAKIEVESEKGVGSTFRVIFD